MFWPSLPGQFQCSEEACPDQANKQKVVKVPRLKRGILSALYLRPRAPMAAGDSLELQAHVDALENRLIAEALARTQGNRTEAAKLLGISRNGLALKMARLGLDPA